MICPRCKRLLEPWPLKRNDMCAPKDWKVCIRTVENVRAQERRQAVKDSCRGMEGQ
jgi:hypothetical protein